METSILQKCFFPMVVSSVSGGEDSSQDVLLRWDKFDLLKEKEKNILISHNVPVTIKKIATQFGLAESEIEDVSRLVRAFYFKEVLKSDLSHELARKIPRLSTDDAKNICKTLNDEIFELVVKTNEELEKEKKSLSYAKLNIVSALEKYPKISEQNITIDQIKIRTMPDLVRPSIKNWISDFQDVMGAKKHSPIDRGNYLFHSDNTKKLSVTDRQKLGTILKSLDEETLLTVDVEVQRIIFTEIEEAINNRQQAVGNGQLDARNADSSTSPSTHYARSGFAQNDKLVTRMNDGLKTDHGFVRNDPVVGLDSRFHGNDNAVQGLDSGSAVRNDNVVADKTSEIENFFQVPRSKPPIGTQDYFARDTEEIPSENKTNTERVDVKKEEVEVQQLTQQIPIVPKSQPQNISYVQTSAPKVVTAILPHDLESASDDELFEAMKQRKPVQKQITDENSSNRFRIGHIDNASGLNFSSPQKFSVEQTAHSVRQDAPANVSPGFVNRIGGEPKVQGNTVNLRD